MKYQSHVCLIASTAILMLAQGGPVAADDWSGWMGSERDGVYRETGIVDEIPAAGLKIKWRKPASVGYAGPAAANGRVFVFDYQTESGKAFNDPGQRVNLKGKERLRALDADTGEQLWEHAYDCPYSVSYPAGPRCTPTVDGDFVYTLGSEGDLKCLQASDGQELWSRQFKRDFAAEVPVWGFTSHPLVAGDLLYCMVGGAGQGVVAFDKKSGEVRWKALDARRRLLSPDDHHRWRDSAVDHLSSRSDRQFEPGEWITLLERAVQTFLRDVNFQTDDRWQLDVCQCDPPRSGVDRTGSRSTGRQGTLAG